MNRNCESMMQERGCEYTYPNYMWAPDNASKLYTGEGIFNLYIATAHYFIIGEKKISL
jgi:hypothetical protein